MDIKKVFRNIIKVLLSNVTTIISGVIVGFVLPKIIGITNYGYYKTFSLYIAYVGIFQLGISEGIYLKYGGKSYEELNKSYFCFYSRFLIKFQIAISLMLIIIFSIIFDSDYLFIFICVALYLLFQNISNYFQLISQITGRFNELAIRNVIKSILTLFIIIPMWFFYHIKGEFLTYKLFTIAYIAIFLFLMLWYIYTYKDITFGKSVHAKKDEGIFSLVKIGFPLLISNLCTSLIFTIDRQCVNLFFDVDTFGTYSFAHNMLSLVGVAASSVALVIYPTLKKMDLSHLKKIYNSIVSWYILGAFICISIYFPLSKFIIVYFGVNSKYVESIPIFRIILPAYAVVCLNTIVVHNYFKIFDKTLTYFTLIIAVLSISIFLNIIAYYLFSTPISHAITTFIMIGVWTIVDNIILKKEIGVKISKNLLYTLINIVVFILSTLTKRWYIGMIIYLLITIMLFVSFNYNKAKNLIKK